MKEDVDELRKKIDEVDEKILCLLYERANICKGIGSAKKALGLPVRDLSREEKVYKSIREKAAKLGLNPLQVEMVYHEIVNMCSSVQE